MKKILYVEDNIDTAEAVKMMLNQAGFEIDIVHTGNDGVKAASTDRYDLLLLDIMLPDMSGWDIYEKTKGKVHSKVAFLSAIPVSHERVDELRKAGVSDYIMKPFSKNDLINRVRRMLQ
jgi:DNA-binding response OmpR family regulator